MLNVRIAGYDVYALTKPELSVKSPLFVTHGFAASCFDSSSRLSSAQRLLTLCVVIPLDFNLCPFVHTYVHLLRVLRFNVIFTRASIDEMREGEKKERDEILSLCSNAVTAVAFSQRKFTSRFECFGIVSKNVVIHDTYELFMYI